MTPFENRLVLNRFLCREFGYQDVASMLALLRDVDAGTDANGESFYFRRMFPDPGATKLTPERLIACDASIEETGRRLRMTPEHGRGWKPHQWLALLFAEHYLRLYFEDPEDLQAKLDAERRAHRATSSMPKYSLDDLRAVAVQSATGSGKTLVMHAHILQYRRIAQEAGRPPRNVILVTPNEQLSGQHEREFRASNLRARIFSSAASAGLPGTVEIIDVNKLAERKGVKRVAVRDFGDNNLVLVDEGHLGSSGKVWRKLRKELAEGGFTFEYSATFNQIVSKDDALRDAYGKSLLFDYSYRAFHADGYGKDFEIANLPGGAADQNSRIYLLGALLSFYRQCRIWREGRGRWAAYQVARPLWVFLGKTVARHSRSQVDREARSDVLLILDFLGWVLAHGAAVRPLLSRLLKGQSGLTGADDADYFAGRFDDLKDVDPDELHDDICKTLFHGAGRLHVRYLTQGEGELHLRTADNAPFGVVNIGDSQALYRLLEKGGNPDLVVERDAGFVRRLFADVDRADSTVNIVIGARRFIAGWNSWRVSAMGLMHVGVREGPEIIQMFGRGVRLKGRNMSLKRHRALAEADPPADSDGLRELETLRIFGLKANYMQAFREILDAEGVTTETIKMCVAWNFAREDLKLLRIGEGKEYVRSDDRPILPESGAPRAKRDFHSRLQAFDSRGTATEAETRQPAPLDRGQTALFNRARIHDRLLERKEREGWRNLAMDRATIDALLDRDDWYDLYLPPEWLEPKSVSDLRKLEDVAVELIADYADRFWRKRRRAWEYERLEVGTLNESDSNYIGAYRFAVAASEEILIDHILTIKRKASRRELKEGPYDHAGFGVLMRKEHAYQPLLHDPDERKVDISVQPVLLNDAEKRVVKTLTDLKKGDPPLRGWELSLIRNQSRGRGVSFFDDHSYYPDFIVWLVKGEQQHILFLDPKGLSRFDSDEKKKVGLHAEIKNVEARIRRNDPTIRLHAYVISVTPPGEIGSDEKRSSKNEWEDRGVYFLEDASWAVRLLERVLA